MPKLILRGGFEKKFPCYEDYDFIVYCYSSMYDMLHDERQIGSYELVIVDR